MQNRCGGSAATSRTCATGSSSWTSRTWWVRRSSPSSAAPSRAAQPALDALRRSLAVKLKLADRNELIFAFLTEFPLFEWNDEDNRWDATHHVFTSPKAEDLALVESDPGRARSDHYDITCNGWEIGSGSIRIHQRELQEKIFRVVGISQADAEGRSGHW